MKKLSKTLIVIAVLAAIVFVASCSRYVEAKPKLIVELRDVMAIDYDPDKNVIYYIGSEDRLNFEDNTQFIKSYNLNTNQHTVIAENFPYLTKPWIGIGESNELFILDNGRNPFHDSLKDPNKRQILVYKDGIIIDSYNLKLIENNKCKDHLSSDSQNSYLGLKSDPNGNIFPKFIISENNTVNKTAYETDGCDESDYYGNLEYYIKKNLQVINEDTFRDTEGQKNYVWVNSAHDFRLRIQQKKFAFMANYECEKVFDLVEFHGKRYNMGSCIWGIHFFPSSGNFFDPDGNLIYASINGINILEKY